MVCVKGRLGVDCRHDPRGDRHSRDRDNRTDEPDLSEMRTRERTVDDIHSGATAGRSRPQRLQLGRKRMLFNCDEKDGPTVSGTSGLTCIIVCSLVDLLLVFDLVYSTIAVLQSTIYLTPSYRIVSEL
jgi:hypothetical protein